MVRLLRTSVLALACVLAISACGSSEKSRSFGTAPPGLPADVPFNLAIYDHAKEVAAVPSRVERAGTVRGHGVLYAQTSRPEHPAFVWVAKGGHVWQYAYAFKMRIKGS